MLYTHARESIFAFGSLSDLHSLMRVCHQWQATVLSMAPRQLEKTFSYWNLPSPSGASAKTLGRHVSKLHFKDSSTPLEANRLLQLPLRFPNMSGLHCKLDESSSSSVGSPLPQFPATLTELSLSLKTWNTVQGLQQVIDAIAQQLPHLTSFTLRHYNSIVAVAASISFAPFIRLPKLTALDMSLYHTPERQLHEIRSLPQLRSFSCPSGLTVSRFVGDVDAPHGLKLTSLGGLHLETEADADALRRLPTLTTFSSDWFRLPHADFLVSLPVLSSLWLVLDDAKVGEAIPRILNGLTRCSQLTRLSLCMDGTSGPVSCTSAQLGDVLKCLPQLQALILWDHPQLGSLSFLSVGTLATTLTSLDLRGSSKSLPLVELRHVHPMRQLRSLKLSRGLFQDTFNAYMRQMYTPPSYLFPALQIFEYTRR